MLNMRIHKRKMVAAVHRLHKSLDEVKEVIKCLPDELPEGIAFHAGNWAVYLELPYDWDKYREVRKCLYGWLPVHVFDNEGGDKIYTFVPPGHNKWDNIKLYVTLKVSMGTSDCRVVQVGEETRPILKVVCNDA